MSITKEHIYDTIYSWVTYAVKINFANCPPYVYYATLKRWMKEVPERELNSGLRELVNTGRLKANTQYGEQNPRITLPEITEDKLNSITPTQ